MYVIEFKANGKIQKKNIMTPQELGALIASAVSPSYPYPVYDYIKILEEKPPYVRTKTKTKTKIM